MSKLRNLIDRFARDESGAALAEYAAIFIVIAIAGTIGLTAIGNSLSGAFQAIGTWVTNTITTPFS